MADCARTREVSAGEEVVTMSICEIPHVFLHLNVLYRFVASPGCSRCAELAALDEPWQELARAEAGARREITSGADAV
jgi:hypothetical protein